MTEKILKDFLHPTKPKQTDRFSSSFDLSKLVNDLHSPLSKSTTNVIVTDGSGDIGVVNKDIPILELTPETDSLDTICRGLDKVQYQIRTFVSSIAMSKENVEDYPEFDFVGLFKTEASKIYNTVRDREICKKLSELDSTSVNSINQINSELALLTNNYTKDIVLTTSALATLQSENKNLFVDKRTNTGNYFYLDNIYVVDDDYFGEPGNKTIFIDSLKETIILVERGKDSIKWMSNDTVYSQNLLFYTRFDVLFKQRKAGKILTLSV